jgi:[acyl-carrier-protein] S-malonyltransferase
MSPVTTWIFPGQGSQAVGMGGEVLAASPAARAVLAEAEAALGEKIGELIANGPAEALERTEQAQPAILTMSIALLEAARERAVARGERLETPIFAAGHSAGQYAAAVAAGALSIADAVRLARRRGELMQASGGGRAGAMAAILGLPESEESRIVAEGAAHGVLVLANRNSPGQIVLSGEVAAIDHAVAAASAAGAKRAVRLQVSAASHSPLMREAAAGMRDALDAVTVHDPTITMLANATAVPIRTAAELRRELSDHLTTGVDWIAAIGAAAAAGTQRYVEVGYGRVLSGLVKRIPAAAGAEILSIDELPLSTAAVS